MAKCKTNNHWHELLLNIGEVIEKSAKSSTDATTDQHLIAPCTKPRHFNSLRFCTAYRFAKPPPRDSERMM